MPIYKFHITILQIMLSTYTYITVKKLIRMHRHRFIYLDCQVNLFKKKKFKLIFYLGHANRYLPGFLQKEGLKFIEKIQ